MKLPQIQKKHIDFTVMGFAIPFVGMMIVMICNGIVPFGEQSFLSTDCYHQYYPYFVAFRRALLSGDSLLYSWNVGLGLDYIGILSYYLASPLNLLSVLIPESLLMVYFNLLTPIRLGFAGFFFAIFLRKLYGKNEWSIALFGSFYALCAWALGYFWNVMWLDTFALLPMVALGTVSLLRDKKFLLYTITLSLSIVCNYYIGFFTCIFVLLVFICYQISRWQGFKRFFLDLLRIALFSGLAIGMTAFLELPAYMALKNTHPSTEDTYFVMNIADKALYEQVETAWNAAKLAWENKLYTEAFSNGFTAAKGYFAGLFNGMRQAAGSMNGGSVINFKEGLPNIYSGNVSIVLACLFLTCRQIKLRDRICAVFLLIFMLVSFVVRDLDYIWHGFHFPKMIPYRFSFLYSFILLYMAYNAYLHRKSFRLWQILVGIGLSLALLCCSNDFKTLIDRISDGSLQHAFNGLISHRGSWNDFLYKLNQFAIDYRFLLFTLAILPLNLIWPIGIWVINLLNKKRPDFQPKTAHRIAATMILAVMSVELVLNLVNFGSQYSGVNISAYPRGTEDSKKIISFMQDREADTLFYRAETSHTQTYNDGALNHYNGITAFTSSANVAVTEFMKNLGFGALNSYNRYSYEEGSPVSTLFLNLKYLIDRDGSLVPNDYFNVVASSGKVTLLENNAYLPLGFLVNQELLDYDFSGDSAFDIENKLLIAATGLPVNVWQPISAEQLEISLNHSNDPEQLNVLNRSKDKLGRSSYSVSSKDTITYRYTMNRDGLMCYRMDICSPKNFSVWYIDKNGNEMKLYSESYSLDQTLSACNVKAGDMIELRFDVSGTDSNGGSGSIYVHAAILDDNLFRAAYDILNESTLELTEFSNTHITGTIDCNRNGVLYTSIPQNSDCWSATVDGKPVQIELVDHAMIAIPLTEGVHTIQLQYENRYFTIGWITSLICLVIFLLLWILVYKPSPKKAAQKLKNLGKFLPKMVSKNGKYLK